MSKSYGFVGVVVLVSAFALGGPPTDALAGQGRGRGAKQAEKADKSDKANKPEKAKNVPRGSDDKPGMVVVDRDGHLRIIREYAHGGSLPPGLAKRESLPPGLRNQLRERGALPPGLQKHLLPVPAPLVTRLPPLPDYYLRYFVGDDLIVVDTRSNQIVAILRDVWR
jgi:hypothetical protein